MKIINDPLIKDIIREAGLLNSLNHQFVINLKKFFLFDKGVLSPSFITPFAQYGDLLQFIQSEDLKTWTQIEKNKFVYGICRSIWFLHQLDIFHRDIKSQNILIMSDKTPLLSDLGLSKFKKKGLDLENSKVAVSHCYSSPESYELKSSYPSDVFALAITLYEFFEMEPVANYILKKSKKTKFIPSSFYKNEGNRPKLTKKNAE